MDKNLRKRRAARAALALLEWRCELAKEAFARETADSEAAERYEVFIQDMRDEVAAFSQPRRACAPCIWVVPVVSYNGAAL